MVHWGRPAILLCPLSNIYKLFLLLHNMSIKFSTRKLLEVLLMPVYSVVTSFQSHETFKVLNLLRNRTNCNITTVLRDARLCFF